MKILISFTWGVSVETHWFLASWTVLNIYTFLFPVIALLVSHQTRLILCWRSVGDFYIYFSFLWYFNHPGCVYGTCELFCFSLMKIGSSRDPRMDLSGEIFQNLRRYPISESHFILPFSDFFLKMFQSGRHITQQNHPTTCRAFRVSYWAPWY